MAIPTSIGAIICSSSVLTMANESTASPSINRGRSMGIRATVAAMSTMRTVAPNARSCSEAAVSLIRKGAPAARENTISPAA